VTFQISSFTNAKNILNDPWFISITSFFIGFIISKLYKYIKHSFWDKKIQKNKIENSIKEANNLYESDNYELSLEKYDKTLEIFNKKDFPELYGIIQRGIGNCYLSLAQINKNEQLLKLAITYFNYALIVFDEKKQILDKGLISRKYKYPLQFAITKTNFAVAYAGLSNIRNKKENLEKAISACKDSLKIYNLNEIPEKYALAMNNLGTYYSRLAEIIDREKNMTKAISCFEEALKFYDEINYPYNHSSTLMNIATSHIILSKVSNKLENILIAIDKYKRALKIIDIEKDKSKLYASGQDGLANAYVELANLQDTEENIRKAISAHDEALKFTPDHELEEIARIKDNMGLAYQSLAKFKDGKENLREATKLYIESLKIRTIIDYPLDYAHTQIHLGTALGELANFEDSENAKENLLNKSIECFNEAHKIYSQQKYPDKYLSINNHLATSHINLSNISDKKKNIEESIKFSNIVTSSTNPMDNLFIYSKAALNLGIAYANLAQIEDKEGNYRKAELYFEEVIKLLENENTNDYNLAKHYLEKLQSMKAS
jgi:tetratricopeptide (TPR) repeat protein